MIPERETVEVADRLFFLGRETAGHEMIKAIKKPLFVHIGWPDHRAELDYQNEVVVDCLSLPRMDDQSSGSGSKRLGEPRQSLIYIWIAEKLQSTRP